MWFSAAAAAASSQSPSSDERTFGKEAQKALDEGVAKAAKREAQLVAGIQAGTAEPLFKQQLEQALGAVETAQQELENWKGYSMYWEDIASQAQKHLQRPVIDPALKRLPSQKDARLCRMKLRFLAP